MTSRKNSRAPSLLLAGAVALAVFLLLLRLFIFVHGHGRARLRGAAGDAAGTVRMARYDKSVDSAAHTSPALLWTDRFADGTPDFLRLTDPADQAAFRQWFTAIADYQAIRPRADVPAEITDCASLLRYAYRESLKRHDETWFTSTGIDVPALPGEIRAWRYPDTPLGSNLFRVRAGSFVPPDATNGAFAQFADAKTIVERNAFFVTRDVHQAQPGDLLFYRQFEQSSPWHSMIVTRIGSQAAVVYDTGPSGHDAHGIAGELRRVTLAELLDHPQPQWRPIPSNPNFLGVYRWNILRGTL
jgi:uncharacterized protein YfaT (DUF1175 family)